MWFSAILTNFDMSEAPTQYLSHWVSSQSSCQWGQDLKVLYPHPPSKQDGGGGWLTCRAFILLPTFFAVLVWSVEELGSSILVVLGCVSSTPSQFWLTKTATVPKMRRVVK